jgi:epoxyqueuosine reductase
VLQEDPRKAIRDKALALGFDAIGFSAPELTVDVKNGLAAFLASGYHGDMGWLADPTKAARRSDPRTLWPKVKSVIVLGVNYGPAQDPLALLSVRDRGSLSVYARNRDYHDIVKKRLKALGRWMVENWACEIKVFVDTAPVAEKPLAQSAGLGWQGKHSNLVSRDFGSWLFLGVVFCDLALAPDEPESDHCGSCRRCLAACPTEAFPAPYRLDARRCISYLTIEHKGHIAREFRGAMGNRIYGCDDCLAVCPWNKYARRTQEPGFLARAELTAPRLADLAALDETAFRRVFSGSPVKRIGHQRFLRNLLIAMGNSTYAELAKHVEPHLGSSSPLIRAMAVWALSRLLENEQFGHLRRRALKEEQDSDVRAEWLGTD